MLNQIACQESDVIDWERCLLGVDIDTDRYLITLTRTLRLLVSCSLFYGG